MSTTLTTTLQAMGSSQAVDEETLEARGSFSPILPDLALSPLAATAGTAWTGTLTGMRADSTLTAVSDDDTTLTVTDDKVSGTFADAGSPNVTVTETFADASNSPHSTTFTVVVSAG